MTSNRFKPLRIGIISPIWLSTPPKAYGSVELITSVLTEALMARGHDVTLYASGDSRTTARLRSCYATPLDPIRFRADPLHELLHVLSAYRDLEQFDVIHDHTFPLGPALGAFAASARPVVQTVHCAPAAFEGRERSFYSMIDKRLNMVAVSEAQRRSTPELRYIEVVHNGLVIDRFPFNERKSDYTLFVGQMRTEKGLHFAIEAARKAGRRLVVATRDIRAPYERSYYEQMVKPLLGPDVEFVGEIGFDEKVELYKNATCTLVPTNWEEPFGLTAVESLACGTPVVGLRRGGTAEIVDHGRTGFLAEDVESLAAYIAAADQVRPADCRRAAEERFEASIMVKRYERVYRRVIAEHAAS